MRVGSRGECLKKLTLIEKVWEDALQGLSNMIVTGSIWNSPTPLGSYLGKIRIRLVLFKSNPEDYLIAKYQNPSKSSRLLSLLAIISKFLHANCVIKMNIKMLLKV